MPEENTQQLPAIGEHPSFDEVINTPRTPEPRRRKANGWTFLQAFGGFMIFLAILALTQWAWSYWGSGMDVTHTQRTVAEQSGWTGGEVQVREDDPAAQPQAGAPPTVERPGDGDVFAWMYIPRLGSDWYRAVQQGTDKVVLNNLGLGHYENSALPGALGNTSYAGHRVPSDLGYIDRLQVGDTIALRTATTWYVYKVSRTPYIVSMYKTEVVSQNVEGRMLTLTTCDPMFSTNPASDRLIVHAQFEYWANVSDGTPKELLPGYEGPTQSFTQNPLVKQVTQRVQRTTASTPITPLLSILCFVSWLLIDLLMLAVSHDRGRRWHGVYDPMTLLWRLQYGPGLVRVVLYALMWGGIVFACFAWVCPLLSDTIPWLESPHVTV